MGKESDVSVDASANPFRFQGFYDDLDTGTYDMQARAYQPSTGRFLQQDRYEDPEADLRLASDPLTSSRYSFTAGNPGTRSEYDGHVPAYTSGEEPKDKHNGDAAAKGADSPGRRAEQQQYDASIAVQDAYYAATGRPLKGEGSHVGPLPPLRAAAAAKGGGGSPSTLRRLANLVGQAADRPIIAANVYGDGATPRDVMSSLAPDVNRIYETYLKPQGCTMVLEAGCYSGLRLGDPGRSSTAEKAGDVTTVFGGAMLRSSWLAAGRTLDATLSKARTVRGAFPEKAGRYETLVRRSPQDGSPTYYQRYGADGLPMQRVDLVGRAYGGVPTPHVVDFTRHTNPRTGEEFVRKNRDVRPATPNEIPKR